MEKALRINAILEKYKDKAITVHSLSLSESFNLDIEGVVNRANGEWYLGVIPSVAVKSDGDEDRSQQFAIIQLSIVDNDALSRILNEDLSDFSSRQVKSFTLRCGSDLPNEKLFQGKKRHLISLKVLIEYEDGNYISPPIDAYIAKNTSVTKRVMWKLGGDFSAPGIILFGITCFQMWGLSTTGGLFFTTVCFGGCIPLFTCECKFKGGGVCLGWYPCACGIKIFGVHVSLLTVFVLIFVLITLIGLGIFLI